MRDSMIKPPAFSRFTLVPFWLLGVLLLLTAVVLWFAVYIVITVLFCPLLLATRGRQIHGACNNFALLPVKLVSKYTRFLQWRASLLEFERGKPAPYPEGRRGLSLVPNQAKAQSESSFFAKLPLELRLQIYKEFIVGESKHLHVVVHRTARIRGYNCSHAFDSLVAGTQDCHAITTDDSEVIYAAYGVAARKYFSLTEVNKRCRGALSLTRTCKKAYLETIDLLYGMDLHRFPNHSDINSYNQAYKPFPSPHWLFHRSSCTVCFLSIFRELRGFRFAIAKSLCPVIVRTLQQLPAKPDTYTGCRDACIAICAAGQH